MSYDNLVKAINDAIEKEAAEHGGKFITDERAPAVVVSTYDYDKEMATFSQLTNSIMSKDQSKGPLITDIVERYLGRGNKVSETTRSQAEMIFLINNDLKEIV